MDEFEQRLQASVDRAREDCQSAWKRVHESSDVFVRKMFNIPANKYWTFKEENGCMIVKVLDQHPTTWSDEYGCYY